ncbi:secreted frizzled-related protein 2-like [Scyliorhinus canicula]|uniref:secreted frizzled-related protein 2-like n=1 Tax=Scyliorhinus canicula TaxID=7830 RepID=UPI0018F5C858|nr:secreted frizzled-related protein 2-like [Scyliorhinus canicula]
MVFVQTQTLDWLEKGAALSALSILVLFLLPIGQVHTLGHGESEGTSFGLGSVEFRRTNCKPIPRTMALCHGVGYSQMRLPNLLGHETMKEALQQASSWVPLLNKQCHSDTRKFLCSLFAPVCLSELQESIQPCRSLCQAVRDSCTPVMSAFGFPWPDMLDCNRFPVDNDLCIPSATPEEARIQQEEPTICQACKPEGEAGSNILEEFCKNDFALKMKVQEISYVNGDAKIIADGRSRVVFGLEGWAVSGEVRMELWLAGGSHCACDKLRDLTSSYLVMGRKQEGRLLITSVRHWRGGKRDFRRMSRNFKRARCQKLAMTGADQ